MSKEEKENTEITKVNMVCFYLIKKCNETNAESMCIKLENVTNKGKELGNWEIKVRKIK